MLNSLFAHFPAQCQPQQIAELGGAGGLSGARIWRVRAQTGELCLRQWPMEHPTPQWLQWMHAVLWHVYEEGVRIVPVPLTTLEGGTFVALEGRLWELSPWMPGEPMAEGGTTVEKTAAALSALAQVHLAAATFVPDERQSAPGLASSGPAPAIAQRLACIDRWRHGGGADQMEQLLTRDLNDHGTAIIGAFRWYAPAVEAELRALCDVPVPLQPCIRDIHDRHVLFTGDTVTGLIDFGAMRIDNVATDVARLLGTLAGAQPALRAAGLAAYGRQRPLSDTEQRLVAAIERANGVLTGMQWLEWLLVERKQFASMPQVMQRLQAIRQQLPGV